MKKPLLLFVFIFPIVNLLLAQQPTQSYEIVTNATAIQCLLKGAGRKMTTTRDVTIKVEYWSTSNVGNSEQQLQFAIDSRTNAAQSSPDIQIYPPTINKDSFEVTHKTMLFTIPITINAYSGPFKPEYFTVGLKKGGAIEGIESGGGILAVNIQKDPIASPDPKAPDGFSFVNAANFDFGGPNGTSYVGNINLFNPKSFHDKGFVKIGYNLGIMKIDFSKNDSLNTSYNYFENVKVHPLDSTIVGIKFLRQYNKLTTVSKNSTFSFYFQPTFSLVFKENFKLLFHLHTELFVDKWTTNTSISNYQQDTGILNTSNINLLKDSLKTLNQFSKSTADIITTTSTSSNLNFNFGFGLTLEKAWDGGTLFIQPTIGWALNYARPESVNTTTLKYNQLDNKSTFAHLTRFRLNQKLTTNILAVIGIDVRGKFGTVPTYAAFIGANIGLDGIKNLLK